MQKWEYHIVVEKGCMYDADINELGSKGWELVAVILDPERSDRLVYHFKRPQTPATQ